MTDTQEAMREEFEKHAARFKYGLERIGNEESYFRDSTQGLWQAWQAATAQSAEKISAEQRYAAMWEQEVAVVKRECAEKIAELQAEVLRLNKWADGFSDAQIKERQTGEMYQRELREKIARLEAENADLKGLEEIHNKIIAQWEATYDRLVSEKKELRKKLAAAELSNKQLRDAIQRAIDASRTYDTYYPPSYLHEALAQQPFTEALDAYVAKKIKEREAIINTQCEERIKP